MKVCCGLAARGLNWMSASQWKAAVIFLPSHTHTHTLSACHRHWDQREREQRWTETRRGQECKGRGTRVSFCSPATGASLHHQIYWKKRKVWLFHYFPICPSHSLCPLLDFLSFQKTTSYTGLKEFIQCCQIMHETDTDIAAHMVYWKEKIQENKHLTKDEE